jgi:DNA-binding NtrC family response regulator
VSFSRETQSNLKPVVREVKRILVTATGDQGEKQTRWLEEGVTMSVGSSADNELVLSDRHVSRYHLELSVREQGVEVRDLGSLNGTFLENGTRLMQAVVAPGTLIRLGNTELTLQRGEHKETVTLAETASIPGMVFQSKAMQQIAALLPRLASASVNLLIKGETGSGKELIAHALHALGPRRERPFVVVDCGSVPMTLVGSELFGHERGAFTGADRRHIGAFERADGGTVFLDEVGELPAEVQPALLGVLERHCFRRVGGDREIKVDVRAVSATNRDLRAEVNNGTFRADLYYRLAGARVSIPPLRERPEDIEPLVRHFARELTGQEQMPFDGKTMESLRAHRFRGNVRELRNIVESALATGGFTLDGTSSISLPPILARDPERPLRAYKIEKAEILEQFERDYLIRLMGRCRNNVSEASRVAGIDRGYLLSLLKRQGLR